MSPTVSRTSSCQGAPSYCNVISVIFKKQEIAAAEYTNCLGFGLDQVPFYDPETGNQLGTYSDFATSLPDCNECVVSGAFSFDEDSTHNGLYRSQINIAFTCGSEMNTITGGSGTYGCASGYEIFPSETDTLLSSNLYLCTELCPFQFQPSATQPVPTMAPLSS